MRPQNLWSYGQPDAVGLAVSYMEGIAQAHAFEQGNKRTGFDAGFLFLNANGWTLHPEADNELMAVSFLELIERTITTGEFEAHLAEYVVSSSFMDEDETRDAIAELDRLINEEGL